MTNFFGEPTYRLLTWKQPFASLMLHGKIETRTWPTRYRGLVLIHAGAGVFSPTELLELCGAELQAEIDRRLKNEPTRHLSGMALAVGELVDCRPMQRGDEGPCFVKYDPARWLHVYQNVQRIEPFPLKGNQSFATLHPDRHAEVLAQIKIIKAAPLAGSLI